MAREDTRVFRINSGVDGVIRATYSDSVATAVKKDQKLAIYYSPEFLSVASGFLAATEHAPGAVGDDGIGPCHIPALYPSKAPASREY